MFSSPFTNIYKNGTYTVLIGSSGTKRYIGQEFKADTPDSLDIKLTEVCHRGCPFCHESSTPSGNHADMDLLCQKLSGLPKGVELALGGGDVLKYPDLDKLLQRLKGHFHVALTIRIEEWLDSEISVRLDNLFKASLISSVGISVAEVEIPNSDDDKSILNQVCTTQFRAGFSLRSGRTVFHIIPGVTSLNTLKTMLANRYIFPKILVLGYKSFGRGASNTIDPSVFDEWKKELLVRTPPLFSNQVLAFDNLAIEQLDIKNHIDRSTWNSCYMGDEFTHSMYIDAVRGEYAPTSRSPRTERKSWKDLTVIDYFKENHD